MSGHPITPEHFTEFLHGFTYLAITAGFLGAFAYDALRALVVAIASQLKQRQRERAFLADLAEIPTGDRWHG